MELSFRLFPARLLKAGRNSSTRTTARISARTVIRKDSARNCQTRRLFSAPATFLIPTSVARFARTGSGQVHKINGGNDDQEHCNDRENNNRRLASSRIDLKLKIRSSNEYPSVAEGNSRRYCLRQKTPPWLGPGSPPAPVPICFAISSGNSGFKLIRIKVLP